MPGLNPAWSISCGKPHQATLGFNRAAGRKSKSGRDDPEEEAESPLSTAHLWGTAKKEILRNAFVYKRGLAALSTSIVGRFFENERGLGKATLRASETLQSRFGKRHQPLLPLFLSNGLSKLEVTLFPHTNIP